MHVSNGKLRRGACALLHKAACVHSVLSGEPREIFENPTNKNSKKSQISIALILPCHLPDFSVQEDNFYLADIIHDATSGLVGER